jgi:hypothetical protein
VEGFAIEGGASWRQVETPPERSSGRDRRWRWAWRGALADGGEPPP